MQLRKMQEGIVQRRDTRDDTPCITCLKRKESLKFHWIEFRVSAR